MHGHTLHTNIIYVYINEHTHACTHTHARTRTHTHAHTHTHTHRYNTHFTSHKTPHYAFQLAPFHCAHVHLMYWSANTCSNHMSKDQKRCSGLVSLTVDTCLMCSHSHWITQFSTVSGKGSMAVKNKMECPPSHTSAHTHTHTRLLLTVSCDLLRHLPYLP